ncbi:dipeptidase [Streptococcus pyogenes]|nr:putative lipoprotein [Streptococcus pyogenes GA19681]ESA45107.1 putative lipoprotein [Streptococcus pyogenes GA19700]ESA46476.1 putative lipoprotein [Streptococcus pyogenes GA41039]ESA49452.1 putative lipoprotein [Streptococcus pyogenes GA41208]VEF03462.1 dipeptidase [Streptococcus pyogenes]
MINKKISLGVLSILTAFSLQSVSYACTGFIIGKDLTKDGSLL